MFASDRTCCVCRDSSRKTEIHHIDEDPANNDFANLALVCKDCQSEAHTKHAFSRNLTPELVTLYNQDWRGFVSERRARKIDDAKKTLAYDALKDIWALANVFLSQLSIAADSCGDTWINNQESPKPLQHTLDITYSPEKWNSYLPIFRDKIPELIARVDRFHNLYRDVLTYEQRSYIMYYVALLDQERDQYLRIPHYPLKDKDAAQNSLFRARFALVYALAKEINDKFIAYADRIFPPE